MAAEPEPGDEAFARLLAWSYRGEVKGEAMFAALAVAWASDGRAETMHALAELERRMALALVPLLARHSVDGGDDERSRRQGRDDADTLAALEWSFFLEQFMPATDAALVRYEELRGMVAGGDPVFDELIAHEQALQDFARSELAGDHARSLEPVHAVIARLAG